MNKIMFVDDDPELLQLGKIMLEKRGYRVVEASGGEECLKGLFQKSEKLRLE